jgi:methylmalonyl-CoA/ethylmalonyl-CoA epimerase
MKIKGLSHIGIAVWDCEKAASSFANLFDLEKLSPQLLQEMGIKLIKLKLGGIELEFLEPLQGEKHLKGFLEKKGEGIHHLAIQVEDLEALSSQLASKGYTLSYEKPRCGSNGKYINFLHPKQMYGVLIELVEKS